MKSYEQLDVLKKRIKACILAHPDYCTKRMARAVGELDRFDALTEDFMVALGPALDELIAEARRRYASDPKTLQALEIYLSAEARARGVN